jgi:hypothetical protein
MSEATPQSENISCEYAGVEVRLQWNEVSITDGLETVRTKIGKRGCSGAGTDNCPVTGKPGQRDWPKCPHLPKF